MIFEQFIDKDLGHVSYLVACDKTKEAFIVDPRRDINEYITCIEINHLQVKYIFNTHIHADYVGGHLELSSRYGAQNIFQKDTPIENYECLKVSGGNSFSIGTLYINIIETPGHTPFDISLLVYEEGIEKLLFTGDFLFVGDIGRADLLGEENREILLKMSYRSAQKLWNLMDDILVFTSHIKGSLCGKNLSNQHFSTIGIEKKTNNSFKLSQGSIEEYKVNLLSQNIETPAFFKKMATLNVVGPQLIEKIKTQIKQLDYNDLVQIPYAQIIDLRSPDKFNLFHLEGAINIYEHSNVSLIAGNILNYDDDIYLVGNEKTNFEEVMIKLLRVGLDKIRGIINEADKRISAGVASKVISINKLDMNVLQIILDEDGDELTSNTIFSSINRFHEINITEYKQVFISCAFGFKSSAVASYLMKENDNIYILSN
jgi:hydroxyacylglutathione hydrolase